MKFCGFRNGGNREVNASFTAARHDPDHYSEACGVD